MCCLWCRVVQCGVVWCGTGWDNVLQYIQVYCSVLQCDAEWCSVVQFGAVQCSVVHCVALCCIALHYDTPDHTAYTIMYLLVRCSVLRCVAVCCRCVAGVLQVVCQKSQQNTPTHMGPQDLNKKYFTVCEALHREAKEPPQCLQ